MMFKLFSRGLMILQSSCHVRGGNILNILILKLHHANFVLIFVFYYVKTDILSYSSN